MIFRSLYDNWYSTCWNDILLLSCLKGPRPGEEDGKDYHFSDKDSMIEMLENNDFIETAEFSGNMYGTSKKSVQDVLDNGRVITLWLICFIISFWCFKKPYNCFWFYVNGFSGKICILDIDTQGVKAVKKVEDFPQPLYIFLKPPSLKVLEERLRSRGTENEESLQKVFFEVLWSIK